MCLVIAMASIQLNVKTSEILIEELDTMINRRIFRNRTEAVNEGIRLLIRRYKGIRIAEKIDKIANENQSKRNLTETLFELREEEDA